MRILAVADTTRSLAFTSVVGQTYPHTDIIISAGDIPLESYDYITTVLGRDVHYVFGNHNLRHFPELMEKEQLPVRSAADTMFSPYYGVLIDGKCVRDRRTGLIIMGLGGCMRYNHGKSQYTERQMKMRILRLVPRLWWNRICYGRFLDILVTHAPAAGLGDREDPCHRGFTCFLSFMDRYSPRYLLHGHVHLEDRNEQREYTYKDTKVINVYGSYLIDDDTLGERDNG